MVAEAATFQNLPGELEHFKSLRWRFRFFSHNFHRIWASMVILVSKHMFWGPGNKLKPSQVAFTSGAHCTNMSQA